MVFGLLHKMMNPDLYMAKLTDYKNESKPLNFIMVRSASIEKFIIIGGSYV